MSASMKRIQNASLFRKKSEECLTKRSGSFRLAARAYKTGFECAVSKLPQRSRPTTGRVARPTSTILIVTDPLGSRQRLLSGTTLGPVVLVPSAGLTLLRTAGETFHLCPVTVITVTVFVL